MHVECDTLRMKQAQDDVTTLGLNESLWIMNNMRRPPESRLHELNKVRPREPWRGCVSHGTTLLKFQLENLETSSSSQIFENVSKKMKKAVISLSKTKLAPGKTPEGALLKHPAVWYESVGERERDPHLWWVIKVIPSKWWNYIQQSPRGSISHCSLTGKINWDLLIHRERPPPPPPPPPSSVSLSKKKRSEGNLPFPSNTSIPPPPPRSRHLPPPQIPPRALKFCDQDVKHEADEIPDMLRGFSSVWPTHRRLLFKCCLCISPVFLLHSRRDKVQRWPEAKEALLSPTGLLIPQGDASLLCFSPLGQSLESLENASFFFLT